jgi:hypothetical protein
MLPLCTGLANETKLVTQRVRRLQRNQIVNLGQPTQCISSRYLRVGPEAVALAGSGPSLSYSSILGRYSGRLFASSQDNRIRCPT